MGSGLSKLKSVMDRSPLKDTLGRTVLRPRLKAYLLAMATMAQVNNDRDGHDRPRANS